MTRNAAYDGLELECLIIEERERAIKVETKEHRSFGSNKFWLPLSQVREIHRVAKTKGLDRLILPRWLFESKLNEILNIPERDDETSDPRPRQTNTRGDRGGTSFDSARASRTTSTQQGDYFDELDDDVPF